MPAVTAGAVWVDVLPSMRNFGRQLNAGTGPAAQTSGQEAGRKWSAGFSTVIKGGALAAAAGATGLATFGLKVAAQNEQAQISFETMLGSAAKAQAFLTQLQAFAAKTPFEFPELQTAASSLISVGVNADKVIPIMTSLGNATSGMGTGAEGVKRATVALQQMSAAGRITGEDLNQLRDAGVPVFDLLTAATGKSTAQIAEMAQKGKLGRTEMEALFRALETGAGLERFSGLMDKQSQSLTGLIATFKDTFGQGLARAIQPALPLVKGVLDGMSGALAGAFAQLDKFYAGLAGKGPIDGFTGAMNTAGLGVSALVAAFKDGDVTSDGFVGKMEQIGATARRVFDYFTTTVVPALRDFGRMLRDNQDVIAAAAAGLGAMLVINRVVAAFTAAVTVIKGAAIAIAALGGPATLIVVGLGALVAALVLAYQRSDTFRAKVDELATRVKNAVIPIVQQFADFIRDRVVPALQQIGQFIVERVVPAVVSFARQFAENLLPVIKSVAEFIVQRVVPAVGQIIGVIKEWAPVVGTIIGLVAGLVGKLVLFVTKILGEVIPAVLKIAGPVFSALVTVITTLISTQAKVIKSIVDVGKNIGSVWTDIKNIFMAGVRFVVDKFLSFVSAIIDGAAKAFGWIPGLGGKLKTAADEFKKFKNNVNASLAGIDDKTIKVNAQIEDVAQLYIKAGQSPGSARMLARKQYNLATRATGGPITGPGTGTSDSIPALLSNGEHVWTAREVQAAGGHGGVERIRAAVKAGRGLALRDGGAASLALATDMPSRAKLRAFQASVSAYGDIAANGLSGMLTKGVQSIAGLMAGPGSTRFDGKTAFPLPRGRYRVGVPIYGYPGHTGQDFPASTGTPVYSPFNGMFNPVRLGNRSYGNYANVVAGSMRSIQAHLNGFARGAGLVRAGELLGYVGSTGNSTGPHLHQEFRRNGSVINPRSVLTFDQGGKVPPGYSAIANHTGGPEALLNQRQWNDMHTIAQQGRSTHLQVFVGDREITDLVRVVVDGRDTALSDTLVYGGV